MPVENLADKILAYLIAKLPYGENLGAVGSREMAQALDVGEPAIERQISTLLESGFVRVKSGKGDNKYELSLHALHDKTRDAFVANGGFAEISRKAEEKSRSQELKQELELEQIRLQIAALQRQPSEDKRTRQLSWLAIIIAAISVLLSAIQMFQTRSQNKDNNVLQKITPEIHRTATPANRQQPSPTGTSLRSQPKQSDTSIGR